MLSHLACRQAGNRLQRARRTALQAEAGAAALLERIGSRREKAPRGGAVFSL
jgi:hypothetical protein